MIATVRTLCICNIVIVTKLQPNDLIAWTSNQQLTVEIYTTLLCDVTLIFSSPEIASWRSEDYLRINILVDGLASMRVFSKSKSC